MLKTPDKVIAIAKAEVGYLEKKNGDMRYLFTKTENAGSNNYTKYAYELDNIEGFYNGKKQGAAWCDVWTDWCFVKAYGVDEGRNLLCQPLHSLGAGVYYSYNYYKAAGRVSKTPRVGDQIFFGPSIAKLQHTGIVWKVDDTYVYTIEGNASTAAGVTPNGGGVVMKSYRRNYNRIMGYGHPAYDSETPNDNKDHAAIADMQTALNKAYKCGLTISGNYDTATAAAVKKHMVKYGKTGAYVKWVQQRLTDIGYRGTMGKPDGIFGPKTKKAVIAFQKARHIGQDGIVGPDTVTQLIRKP